MTNEDKIQNSQLFYEIQNELRKKDPNLTNEELIKTATGQISMLDILIYEETNKSK
jgi:hypothetical protein